MLSALPLSQELCKEALGSCTCKKKQRSTNLPLYSSRNVFVEVRGAKQGGPDLSCSCKENSNKEGLNQSLGGNTRTDRCLFAY